MFFIILICVNFVCMAEFKSYTLWPIPRTAADRVRATLPTDLVEFVTFNDCPKCNQDMPYDKQHLSYIDNQIRINRYPQQFLNFVKMYRSITERENKRIKDTGMHRFLRSYPYYVILDRNKQSPGIDIFPFLNKIVLRLGLTLQPQMQIESIASVSSAPVTSAVPTLQTLDVLKSLDIFERKFYAATFSKMSAITRNENGPSFVQSALFLQLLLLVLSVHVDHESRDEIENSLKLKASRSEKFNIIRRLVSSLPYTDKYLKFYWAYRLLLRPGVTITDEFLADARALHLYVDRFNDTEKPEEIVYRLNKMVETDSGGAIHNTFEIDDIDDDSKAVFLTTVYFRSQWRSAPTVLNGTLPFIDDDMPQRTVRCIRINDVMRYADLNEWDAEAIEMSYATKGLTLLIIVPRGRSLRHLSNRVAATSIDSILMKMQAMRIAATLPLYTLRMTVILPDKLEALGMSRLTKVPDANKTLTMAQGVQRVMFWAEAGRNAFKDDGIEWDETPELELVINKPYIFFVRWRNMTLMNGHFVL